MGVLVRRRRRLGGIIGLTGGTSTRPSSLRQRFLLSQMGQSRFGRLWNLSNSGKRVETSFESRFSTTGMDIAHEIVADTFHKESDRILATLIGTVKDFELAEDALQDALLVALEHWPVDRIPRNPSAWITTTARRKTIDRLRRHRTLARKQTMLPTQLQQQNHTPTIE